MAEPTLFDWAGGRDGIARMINTFYDRVENDDLLSPFFPGGVSARHREHVIDWWSEVFGGPAVYTEQHGGYENMLAHHVDLGITREQRHRFAGLMSLAADDADLPDDPEFRAALVGYLEWGTRLAMANSQPGAVATPHAPVPRWGWGVAPPYQPSKSFHHSVRVSVLGRRPGGWIIGAALIVDRQQWRFFYENLRECASWS